MIHHRETEKEENGEREEKQKAEKPRRGWGRRKRRVGVEPRAECEGKGGGEGGERGGWAICREEGESSWKVRRMFEWGGYRGKEGSGYAQRPEQVRCHSLPLASVFMYG